MMPDDAATLARFDAFLDGLVGGDRADADGLDADVVGAADRVHRATRSIAPDPVFARNLRRSLMQRTEAATTGAGTSAPLRLTSSPWTRWILGGRWRPRLELAFMLLVIVAVA